MLQVFQLQLATFEHVLWGSPEDSIHFSVLGLLGIPSCAPFVSSLCSQVMMDLSSMLWEE